MPENFWWRSTEGLSSMERSEASEQRDFWSQWDMVGLMAGVGGLVVTLHL